MKFIVTLLFVCCFLLGTNVNAQSAKPNTFRWDVAVMPGISVKYGNSFIAGAETRIEQKFGADVSWMASAGYTHFENVGNGFIHVKGGLKVFIVPTVYLASEIGLGEYTQGGEAFIFAPSIGMMAGKKWDLSVKYEDFGSSTAYPAQMALRIGYRIN